MNVPHANGFLCRKFVPFISKKTRLASTSSSVRVRFAPSPTGFMHLGGLRTALFNKLFAVKHSGKFILRIEDTDKSRSQPYAKEDILESLNWCGLIPDEGPLIGGNYGSYIQSERKHLYSSVVQKLIDEGYAYRCFCSSKRLAILRNEQSRRNEPQRYDNRCRNLSEKEIEKNLSMSLPYTVRFKTGDSPITVNDIVFGSSVFNSLNSDGDFIIMKSDGMPVYHLANVVDDHYMEISHVIRGVEWLASTPKHLLLYSALNWSPPQFAHLPLLLSSSGGKLSKRCPEFSLIGNVRCLRKAGYLPTVIINWLTSTGGAVPYNIDNITHFNDNCSDNNKYNCELVISELASQFNLTNINRHNAQLSVDLLKISSRLYFDKAVGTALDHCLAAHQNHTNKTMTVYKTPQILEAIREYLQSNVDSISFPNSHSIQDDVQMLKQLSLLKGRIHCLSELATNDNGFLYVWKSPDPGVCKEHIFNSGLMKIPFQDILSVFEYFVEEMNGILPSDNNTSDTIAACLKKVCQRSGVKRDSVMHLIRLGLTGSQVGSPVVELIQLLSVSESIDRINKLHNCLLVNQHSQCCNEAL
ncbi:unnamed protein product [Trichobilharzia szidati]|nr:unnamed protein product [Trichobilharzia szidati]